MNLRECSVCCWGEHILQLLPGMFCTCLWCPFGLACNLIPMFFCCICLLLLKEGHKISSCYCAGVCLFGFPDICFTYLLAYVLYIEVLELFYLIDPFVIILCLLTDSDYITLYVMEVWIFLFSSGLNLYGTSLWQNCTLYLRLTSNSQQPSQFLLLSVGIIDTSHNI